jgi:hypothetical protein
MRSRFVRYSLQTLLFALLCLGSFLLAYRAGLDRGYKEADLSWGVECVNRDYVLTDLAGSEGLYFIQDIEEMLRVGIAPTTWDTVGGPGSIQVRVDKNGQRVLMINQHPGVHDEIVRILEELRAGSD